MGIALPIVLWQMWLADRHLPVMVLGSLWAFTALFFVADLVRRQRSRWSVRLALLWVALYVPYVIYELYFV